MTANTLILTAEGFILRPELADLAASKTAKLLRHEHPPVHRVRLHVRHETPRHAAPGFIACATAEHAGPDHVAHASAAEPRAVIAAALAKLERGLREAAGARKHARHARVPAEPLA